MLISALFAAAVAVPPDLDQYNLVWSSPSGEASGSMPIGNGVLGANVWVERGGDILLLLSRPDTWSETDRLLKLGRVRVHIEPSPFTNPTSRQTLRLSEGQIVISSTEPKASVRIYVTPAVDQIRIEGTLAQAVRVSATLENWRTSKHTFENNDELMSSWTMRDAPVDIRKELVWESPDIITTYTDNLRRGVLWYHRNEHSIVPFTLKHQGLEPIADKFPDPLLHRTFGGYMEPVYGLGVSAERPGTLDSANPTESFGLRITTHAAQTPLADAWSEAVRRLATPEPGPDGGAVETAAAWSKFWDRSWVFVEGDTPASQNTNVPRNEHPFRLGADSNGQNVYRGQVGTYGVYAEALGGEAIARLAAAGHLAPAVDVGNAILSNQSGVLKAVGAAESAPVGTASAFKGGHLEAESSRVGIDRSFTLHAYIKPDAGLGPARIFDKMTAGGSDGFIFDTHPGDSLRLIVGDLIVHAHGVLKRGEWQHAAATYDADTGVGTIYLNGKAVATNGPRWADPSPPSRVTQAYVLQRWVQACGSGVRIGTGASGEYPIKFNGSIFTVEPAPTQGQPHNPDWRKWGGSFWWQNTRLPYYPMLASGDFEMMQPLFRFFENAMPGSVARTKLYYNAEGVYFPETITTFGTYSNGDYGWKRDGMAASDISPCPWWQYAWNQSLELTQIMLDYAAYTGDERFLRERALPMARQTLLYFDTRFKLDEQGRYIISPTQAVETYWHSVIGDAPSIGGLRTITAQLRQLQPSVGNKEDRELWDRVARRTPPLPTREKDGKRVAAPALVYKDQRTNCETAELYPLWPFREYDLARPDGLEAAINAYRVRVDKSTVGWTQDGLFAARLGLVDEAKSQLLARAANSNKNHRFPTMWGPNFDWLPDQCHGGNLLTQTQLMLVQADTLSDRILLLPAWPKEWNVSFKLHATRQTTIECVYKAGKIEKLVVTPESRRKDVVLPEHLR